MNLLHKLTLYAQAVRQQFRADKAYIVNVWIDVAGKAIYNIMFILFMDQLFKRVGSIAGYSYNDFLCMYLISQVGFYICYYGIFNTMNRLVAMINNGSLDFLLLKPVPHRSYLYASSLKPLDIIFTFLPMLAVVVWQIDFAALSITPVSFILASLMMLCGVVICNTLMTILVLPAFKTGEATDSLLVFYSISTISQMPYDKIPAVMKVLSLVVLPQIIISAASTQVLLGKHDVWATVLIVTIAGAVSWMVSRLVWRYALRQYTSASS